MAPPALEPFEGIDDALRALAAAAQIEPGRAELHAAIGNGLVRKTRYLEAIEAYRAAITANYAYASAHLMLAELLFLASDPQAQAHLDAALRLQRVYETPRAEPAVKVLMLLSDASYSSNAPLEMIADRDRIALHKYYLGDGNGTERLPNFDVAFCAFGYSRAAEPAIRIAAMFEQRSGSRVINSASLLRAAAREELRATVADIRGVTVPDVRLLEAAAVEAAMPTLVRPADTHAGLGLALVRGGEDVRAHTARWPAERYHVAPFIEYVSPDGYYRKYRVLLVDGAPYPYHLAISPRWMVHYRNAPMSQNAWMREEEAAFLSRPASVFALWETFADVARAIGLDYVGVDCTLLADGSMLIFEADPAMLVHDEDPGSIFAYKRPAVAAIREALTTLIAARAGSTTA